MDKKYIIGGLFGFFVAFLFMSFSIDAAIPPTPAFFQIITSGQNITAIDYKSSFEIIPLGELGTSITNDTISVKLKEFSCPVLQHVSGVDEDGNFVCSLSP